MDNQQRKSDTCRAWMQVLIPSTAGAAYIVIAVTTLGPWALLALGFLVWMLWPDRQPHAVGLAHAWIDRLSRKDGSTRVSDSPSQISDIEHKRHRPHIPQSHGRSPRTAGDQHSASGE